MHASTEGFLPQVFFTIRATTSSGYRDQKGDGDFRLFDITDPANLLQALDWDIQNIGNPFYAGQGCDADPNYGYGAESSNDNL